MVKVREDRPVKEDGTLDITQWVSRLVDQASLDSQVWSASLESACELAQSVESQAPDATTSWGESFSTLPAGLEMAEILAGLQMDCESLVAALVYRSVREGKLALADVRKQFGDPVADLVDGVKKMAAISRLTSQGSTTAFGKESDAHSENVRKMLVAIVDDVRVALIKLAERTCAIRAVKTSPIEKRQRVAREVAEVYAPLAHRLGIGHIKWELEDLSFRYLYPFDYKYIAKLLDERRVDRQNYINEVISELRRALGAENIHAEISGRAKHIYSIWRKMRRKSIEFSEVYDIRAVRILVDTESHCYTALGAIHALWHSIPNEFDDYIANPKENGYRSLHTAVRGPGNQNLEVQIRTHRMHEEAEFGVCAHWRYKGADGKPKSGSYEKKIEWLREVLEWHEEVGSGRPWDDHLPKGVEHDRIYVFTPDGHVIDLPEKATPVDFAFRIHSDVGIRCRGAKVNNRIVPLTYALKTADQVEILTGKRESPSRDWLNDHLGYITTTRARSRLHQWFKEQDRDQNISDGQALLDREFNRLGVENLDFESLTKRLQLSSLEDLYAAVGNADISVDRVVSAAQKLLKAEQSEEVVLSLVGRASDEKSGLDAYIDGVGSMMSKIAQCCKPLPGDRIAGYITHGRGVSIHRQDCTNYLQLSSDEPERIIEVGWAEKPGRLYATTVKIEAFDRHGLLRDITTLLDREKINVSAMQTLSDKDKNTVDMSLTIEVSDFSVLSRILGRIDQLPNVSKVWRGRE